MTDAAPTARDRRRAIAADAWRALVLAQIQHQYIPDADEIVGAIVDALEVKGEFRDR